MNKPVLLFVAGVGGIFLAKYLIQKKKVKNKVSQVKTIPIEEHEAYIEEIKNRLFDYILWHNEESGIIPDPDIVENNIEIITNIEPAAIKDISK